MIDPEVIEVRLDKIQENLVLLRKIDEIPLSEFVSNSLTHSAAERAVQVSIQAVIDICSYLVSEMQNKMPASQRDLPEILRKAGVFPKELANKLSGMIGVRNVLVHQYLDVDLNRVHSIIQNNLGDFDEFAKYVVEYLEKEGIA